MIVIVDYGLGNLASIQNMIKKVGFTSVISSDADEISLASKIILPGIGAFDEGMKNIDKFGLRDTLVNKALVEQVPFLGICLGMHLMTRKSQEGGSKGLSLVDAVTVRFPSTVKGNKLRSPHIGWNYVKKGTTAALTRGFDEGFRFYFVHTYYVKLENPAHCILQSNYGADFTSGYAAGNLLGVQFHPEKSHRFGKRLFDNFLNRY